MRLRVVRRVARFAVAFFVAFRRRFLAGAFFAALRRFLAGAFFAAFFVALRRFLAGAFRFAAFFVVRFFVAFFATLRLVALRFAGAFFAAFLRLAGAFLAALLFVAFLAGGTVTTFHESSHSGKFELRFTRPARECDLAPYSIKNSVPGP